MRLLLTVVALLGSVALLIFGGVSALVGYAEQHSADQTYVIGFKQTGSGCSSGELFLSVENGKPLYCEPVGVRPMSGSAGLPGFTDSQNEEVLTLAARLGRDRLSGVDEQQLQALVDKFAATVPAAARPDHHSDIWGARRLWLGVGAFAVGLIGWAVFRPRNRQPRPKPTRPPRGQHL
jgi:hypothetical protein